MAAKAAEPMKTTGPFPTRLATCPNPTEHSAATRLAEASNVPMLASPKVLLLPVTSRFTYPFTYAAEHPKATLVAPAHHTAPVPSARTAPSAGRAQAAATHCRSRAGLAAPSSCATRDDAPPPRASGRGSQPPSAPVRDMDSRGRSAGVTSSACSNPSATEVATVATAQMADRAKNAMFSPSRGSERRRHWRKAPWERLRETFIKISTERSRKAQELPNSALTSCVGRASAPATASTAEENIAP
mmetsp:Transcript_117408/g.269693  ORF Transcript_117408/g.269693 Transcript_117408/m.269693 type:complete len:244 (+) Transcript_117408:272-1003(+)